MSELLSQLDPWMEQECFHAIMNGDRIVPKKTTSRFVQVMERRSSSLYVLSDCHAHMLCTCTSTIGNNSSKGIEKGAIVQLQSYTIVVANTTAESGSSSSSSRSTNSINSPSPSSKGGGSTQTQQQKQHYRLSLLTTAPIKLVGAQGMSMIDRNMNNAPIMDIHETIQVRRALQESPAVIEQIRKINQSAQKQRKKSFSHHHSTTTVGDAAVVVALPSSQEEEHQEENEDETLYLTQDFAATTPLKTAAPATTAVVDTPPTVEYPRVPPLLLRNGNPLALLQNEEKLNRILLETMNEHANDDMEPETTATREMKDSNNNNEDDDNVTNNDGATATTTATANEPEAKEASKKSNSNDEDEATNNKEKTTTASKNGNPFALLQNDEKLNRILLSTSNTMNADHDDHDVEPEKMKEVDNNSNHEVDPSAATTNDDHGDVVEPEKMKEVNKNKNHEVDATTTTNADDDATLEEEKEAPNSNNNIDQEMEKKQQTTRKDPTTTTSRRQKTLSFSIQDDGSNNNNPILLLANAVNNNNNDATADNDNDEKKLPFDDSQPMSISDAQQQAPSFPLKRPFKRGLSQVLCTDDEGEPDDQPDTQAPVTRSVFDRHVDDDDDDEYHLPLKETTSPSSPFQRAAKRRNRRFRNNRNNNDNKKEAPYTLAAVAEKGNASNSSSSSDDDDDDDEPVGISEMLLPSQDDHPMDTTDTQQSLTINAPNDDTATTQPRTSSSSAITTTRPDFLSVTTPRETSTETLETSHVRHNHNHHDGGAMPNNRFDKVRSFYMRLWDQRHEPTIVFR